MSFRLILVVLPSCMRYGRRRHHVFLLEKINLEQTFGLMYNPYMK